MVRKSVLITGITGGIGRAIAVEFARNGWDIIGQYCRDKKGAQVLKGSLEALNARVSFIRADMTVPKDVNGLLSAVKKLRVDSLINNAGGYVRQRDFFRLTMDDLSGTFMLNAFVPILLAKQVFPQMRKRGFGWIVNVSSIAAKFGGSLSSVHYGCAKRALEGLTRSLARAGAGSNILVNSVRPGVIDTDFHQRFPKDMEQRIKLVPLRRMGRPEEVAGMVFYLGSDKNSYVTNETVTIAGGE